MFTRESQEEVIPGGIMDRENVLGSNSNVLLKCALNLPFVIWLTIFTHSFIQCLFIRTILYKAEGGNREWDGWMASWTQWT